MTRPFLSLLVFAWIASACAPELGVGTAACIGSAPLRIPEDASDPVSSRDPVDAWETDFENGFCDFRFARGGFCYASPDAAYELVTSPVRSGQRAAAFSVTTDPDLDGEQARCVREGALPAAAYYGAWYYLPASATNEGNWNLIHFQGGDDLHGLWDVSLDTTDDGELSLYVYDFIRREFRRPASPRPVPIESWFQIVFYLRRSADATGAVALYQDGELLWEATDLVTDDSDWGQWYVGNLADALSPQASTVYVDDITIRTAL
ncbi:MAG TPA: heparin lyase I family protein [Polyangiaceae bacterium]|nr:heparin lyase I family protein [Polyangiaceae bacterium]